MQPGHRTVNSTPSMQTNNSTTIRSEYADVPAVRRVLPEYITGLSSQVRLLHQCLGERRLGDLRRAVHQLRGTGGAYGFGELSRLAAIAECTIDKGQALETISDDIRNLADAIRNIEGYAEHQ